MGGSAPSGLNGPITTASSPIWTPRIAGDVAAELVTAGRVPRPDDAWPSPGLHRSTPGITTASSPIWTPLSREGRDRERNVQRAQNQRIQPRAQLWARQGDTGSVLVALNLLAFGFHTAAMLAVLAWRQAVIARGATYRSFEHLRTITAFVLDQDRDHLLRSITAAATRPP